MSKMGEVEDAWNRGLAIDRARMLQAAGYSAPSAELLMIRYRELPSEVRGLLVGKVKPEAQS